MTALELKAGCFIRERRTERILSVSSLDERYVYATALGGRRTRLALARVRKSFEVISLTEVLEAGATAMRARGDALGIRYLAEARATKQAEELRRRS